MWARWLSTVRSLTVGVREVHAERGSSSASKRPADDPGADMMRLMTRRWACWTPASRCNYTRAGMVDSRAQAEVQAAADELVASRAEIGLQVAAIHEGRTVVDVVSGVSDTLTGAAVARDTLFYAASTAKAVASTLAHVLVEPGVLSYDSRVANVWPEFGGAPHRRHAVRAR